jgi:hypothetical protein
VTTGFYGASALERKAGGLPARAGDCQKHRTILPAFSDSGLEDFSFHEFPPGFFNAGKSASCGLATPVSTPREVWIFFAPPRNSRVFFAVTGNHFLRLGKIRMGTTLFHPYFLTSKHPDRP